MKHHKAITVIFFRRDSFEFKSEQSQYKFIF
jgi:hypothetical protein